MAQNEGVIKLYDDGFEGKQSWPELVGVPGKVAKETIQKENPKLTQVVIVLIGTPITLDYRFDRVRIFVNYLGIVIQVPRVG
ncbi:hypothetical protein F6Q10_35165 [Streptomyces vinaceus]|nr:hypothetical protein [Streptomyces vinaceus]